VGVLIADRFQNETRQRIQYQQKRKDLPFAPADPIERRQDPRQDESIGYPQRLGGFDGP